MTEFNDSPYFIAYMNKRYASTFKLTYINDNGQTIGQPLTIDLSGTQKSAVAESKLSVSQNGVALHYKLSPQIENLNGQYTICNVNNTMHRKQGEVQSSNGVISIIDLPKGIYTFSITCNGKTYSTKWMKYNNLFQKVGLCKTLYKPTFFFNIYIYSKGILMFFS